DFKFNSIDVTLQAPNVINEFTGLTANKDVVDGVDATVNIFNYLSVVDFKGTQLVCSEATEIANVWAWVNKKVKPYAFYKDCYLIYGQTPTFAAKEKLTIKHNGSEIDASLVNFTYNSTAGTITLDKNNAELNGTVTFVIPVELGYIYNNGTPRQTDVTVNFKRAE
ncbi:MAG: hypothetical protein MSA02_06130, partial [Bacteroidales bacterium]|nr:hypothetical protein [Bacteroidales bacterium]